MSESLDIVSDATRFLCATDEGKEIQLTKESDGGLYIEINNPWAGCTETGFGAATGLHLSKNEAEEIARWIGAKPVHVAPAKPAKARRTRRKSP